MTSNDADDVMILDEAQGEPCGEPDIELTKNLDRERRKPLLERTKEKFRADE